MSRGMLLTGTAGGIIGAITTAFGIAWIFILNTFQTEISYYVTEWGYYLTSLLGTYTWDGVPVSYSIYPIPYFPSASLFGVSSFILTVFLIVTGILIGVGFYGMYKIGGGEMGVVGLVFGVMGVTVGALLIIMANLATAYEQALLTVGAGEAAFVVPVIPVPTPNYSLIWIGFLILGFAFIVLGSVSISVREMTEKPSVSLAAGILSIMTAVVLILFNLIGLIPVQTVIALGAVESNISAGIFFGGIIGFWPILVAFILWAVVFYSSRNV